MEIRFRKQRCCNRREWGLAFLLYSAIISLNLKYSSPLKYSKITGTFCEYRENHFHNGVDFGCLNLPVYSVADGFIYRIRNSNTGYGKTIYLQHADNNFSVYAHLAEFEPEIEKCINFIKLFIDSKLSEDFFLPPSFYRIQKNKKIAISGDTGSAVPHLHFALYNNKGEYLNPLIKIEDKFAPVIEKIFIMKLSGEETVFTPKQIAGKNIILNEKSIIKLQCYDKINTENKVGIYKLSVYLDNKQIYNLIFDKLFFWNYQKAPLVYDQNYSSNNSFIYFAGDANRNRGILNPDRLSTKKKYNIRINIEDASGKSASVLFNFTVQKKRLTITNNITAKDGGTLLSEDKRFEVSITPQSLYNDFYVRIIPENISGKTNLIPLSFAYRITPSYLFFKKKATILFYSLCKKAGIFRLKNNRWSYIKNSNRADIDFAGTYCLMRDTGRPIIEHTITSTNSTIFPEIKIYDRESDIDKITVKLDGRPLKIEYDIYKKRIIFQDRILLLSGKHCLEIIACDVFENKTRQFIRFSSPTIYLTISKGSYKWQD